MSRSFASFAEWGAFVGTVPGALTAELDDALHLIGNDVAADARNRMGVYQGNVGPFAYWDPLTERTMTERVELGFTPNDPLLRSGELRDSIDFSVSGPSVSVGSPLEKAADMENGVPNRNVPARPFIGPAMYNQSDANRKRIMDALRSAFTG